MNTHIQIRNVPTAVHRKLKRRAQSADLTITDYVKRLIVRDLEKPTLAEFFARMKKEPAVAVDIDFAALIREDRDSR